MPKQHKGDTFRSQTFEKPEELVSFVNDNADSITVVAVTSRDAGYIGYDLFYWELDRSPNRFMADC